MPFTRPEVELDASELALGAAMFQFLTTWRHWVHRRVERVTIVDHSTSERQQSIDFTMPPVPRETLTEKLAPPTYVPLTLLEKHRVTHFSLWDASRRSLPLVTQSSSARIATATLAVAALRVWGAKTLVEHAGDRKLGENEDLPAGLAIEPITIPTDVLDDLGMIAEGPRVDALAAWASFGDPPAKNRGCALSKAKLATSKQWRRALLTEEGAADQVEAAQAFRALARDVAGAFLVLTPSATHVGVRQVVKLSYERHRHADPYFMLIIKEFVSYCLGAPWAALRGRLARMLGRDPQASADDTTSAPWYSGPRTFHSQFRRKVERFFALRAKVFHLDMPSVGRCECFHLEIEPPDGLQVTSGTLVAYDQGERPPAEDRDASSIEADHKRRSVPRLHLHLAMIPQHWQGRASFELSLRPSTLMFQVWVWAVLSCVLFTLIAVNWDSFREYSDRVLIGLPLVVSVLIALALRRDGEAGIVTTLLRGIRFIAFGVGAWSFLALAVVAQRANCTGQSPAPDRCVEQAPLLFVFAIVAMGLTTALPLTIALWRSWSPPPSDSADDGAVY